MALFPYHEVLKVDEIFETLQGESRSTGYPSVFVRLYDCNVRCSYCDTMPQVSYSKMRVNEIVHAVSKYQSEHVCITGGEPMLQDVGAVILANALVDMGYKVSIETNGIAELSEVPNRKWRYVMDVKMPSSGVFKQAKKALPINALCLESKDEIKFVIQNGEDWDAFMWALKETPKHLDAQKSLFKPDDPLYWWKFSEKKPDVLVSPVFDFPPTKEQIVWGAELSNRILKMGLYFVRLQVQIHKILGLK